MSLRLFENNKLFIFLSGKTRNATKDTNEFPLLWILSFTWKYILFLDYFALLSKGVSFTVKVISRSPKKKMGWVHPDISLEEMVKLTKGFVDILILASGYQSSGRIAHWDAQNIKKIFHWGLFFENVSNLPLSNCVCGWGLTVYVIGLLVSWDIVKILLSIEILMIKHVFVVLKWFCS